MMNSKKNKTTKRKLQVNNYQVVFDIVNIQESLNSIDSRVARLERQNKEKNKVDNNNDNRS